MKRRNRGSRGERGGVRLDEEDMRTAIVPHTIADAVTLNEIERCLLLELDGRGGEYEPGLSYVDYAAWQRATYGRTWRRRPTRRPRTCGTARRRSSFNRSRR